MEGSSIELPNQEKNRNAWRKGNQVLGNIESGDEKKKNDKKYLKRT